MTQEGFSTPTIGITLACYFLGLVFGYFLYHRLIQRVGHIRSFAIFAVYPVAVARANDVFEGQDAVAVSSALLLCYSIGAIFGPILASIIMTLSNTPYGLYV